MNNNIDKIFVKKLIESDQFKYIYDEKDVHHNDPPRFLSFYNSVKKDLQKINLIYEVEELRQMWTRTREKFMKINLRKSRCQKISEKLEKFYSYFIFLEDYITHKNENVYKTQNKKEVMEKIYDEIMGNTYENNQDEDAEVDCVQDEPFNIDDFPDLQSLFNNECEDIEILKGYENIVQENLEKEKKKVAATKNDQIVTKIDMPSKQKSSAAVKKTYKSNFYPITSMISPLQIQTQAEMKLGNCRAKHEQLINNNKEIIINQIIQIFNKSIIEKTTIKSRTQMLQLILTSIKKFCAEKI